MRVGKLMTEVACPLCMSIYRIEDYEVLEDKSAPYKKINKKGEEIEVWGNKFYCEDCKRWMRIPPGYHFIRNIKVSDEEDYRNRLWE